MLVDEHEKLLRNECGYTGPYPYWDWTIDADANTVPTSPVWDPVTGFGGNGANTGNSTKGFQKCVTNGPYANVTLHIGTSDIFSNEDIPHCLVRDWNNGQSAGEVGDMRRRSVRLKCASLAPQLSELRSFATVRLCGDEQHLLPGRLLQL